MKKPTTKLARDQFTLMSSFPHTERGDRMPSNRPARPLRIKKIETFCALTAAQALAVNRCFWERD